MLLCFSIEQLRDCKTQQRAFGAFAKLSHDQLTRNTFPKKMLDCQCIWLAYLTRRPKAETIWSFASWFWNVTIYIHRLQFTQIRTNFNMLHRINSKAFFFVIQHSRLLISFSKLRSVERGFYVLKSHLRVAVVKQSAFELGYWHLIFYCSPIFGEQ